jgi:hypothetical protein
MDPSNAYYKTKRNLLLFVGCLLLAIFAGFKIADAGVKISILPFQLARPEYLTTILFIAVVFNLFQFSLHWAAQQSEVQQNRFHRIDFISTTAIGGFSIFCYFCWLVISYFEINISFERTISLGKITATLIGGLISIAGVISISKITEGLAKTFGKQIRRKAASEDEEVTAILESKIWILVYNPTAKVSKKITFDKDGTIGIGRNQNENTWRVTHGLLEIRNSENQVFSRFLYDRSAKQFSHTNDEDTLSIRSQTIVPAED